MAVARRINASARTALSRRTQVVWASLVGTMTVLGGTLWALDRGPGMQTEGINLPALLAESAPSNIESVLATRVPLRHDQWTSIVIHHSGSPFGTPASLQSQALAMQLRGIGYHFVVGNGNGLDDGEIHITDRWQKQVFGAHAAGPQGDRLNRSAIGICLVGDGDRWSFTPTQMTRVVELVRLLQQEFHIPRSRVVLHSDIAAVSSPGNLFPAAAFREQLLDIKPQP